jgi:hypothetical protein
MATMGQPAFSGGSRVLYGSTRACQIMMAPASRLIIFKMLDDVIAIRPALVSTAKGGGLMSNCFGERVSPRGFTNDSITFLGSLPR